jgi:5-methylcytosine-specific restriction endonuclease McrA
MISSIRQPYHNQYWKDLADKIKSKLHPEYGCACCGTFERLTIDHKNPNDPKRRRSSSQVEHLRIWREQDFDNLQILCIWCNQSKGKSGDCKLHSAKPIPIKSEVDIDQMIFEGYKKLILAITRLDTA